jgi:peptidoglycan/LPS O-acetylase OafA/YrhL
VIRDELAQISAWGERHRRLVARLTIVLVVTALVDVAGTILVYLAERHADGTAIHDVRDALFFTTVQLLTVSSQLPNPLTGWGRMIDVVLEIWAVVVVAGSAGAMAAFFQNADAPEPRPAPDRR